MKKPNLITQELTKQMNKQLLLHAAGTYMFCPKCGSILDWSTVVIIDVYSPKKDIHKGKQVACTHCTKNLTTIDFEALEKKQNISIEICSKNFTR